MLTRSLPMTTRRRWGFTLIELLIVLALFGFVGAITVRILVRQQRFYSGSTDILAMRGNLRDVASVVPTDLRGISSVGGDIFAMSDSAVDFRLPTGQGIVCTIAAGRLAFVIPPPALTSRSAVTSWLGAPVSGDEAFVFGEGPTMVIDDDRWFRVTLSAAPAPAGVCPTATGFTATAAEAAAGYTLTVAPALPADVVVGSVVRFYRRTKYKLYQPTPGGSWYLGYFDCPGGICGNLQAVAGPYLPYTAAGATTGLRFVYRDSTGAVTAIPTSVARIDITARAQTTNPVQMPGRPNDYIRDSLVVSVALRNRS
jgi:prepilin-type N-terminal cleavage/methylation domain-containing protein